MAKKIARRTKKKTATAKPTPNKIDVVNALLKNIYFNGFKDHRAVSYRIARSTLRDFADVQRLEAGTMKKLIERVRDDGFILYPLDKSEYSRANEWVFDKVENQRKLPFADRTVINNAQERSEELPD